MEVMVSIVLVIASGYLICGLLFAIAFVLKGITVIDENARNSSIGFRIIIIPGIMVFWPLLLIKWIQALKNKT